MKHTFGLVFCIFVMALLFSVISGLMMLWNLSFVTKTFGRAVGTGVIITIAALFYMSACDAWFRIRNH